MGRSRDVMASESNTRSKIYTIFPLQYIPLFDAYFYTEK